MFLVILYQINKYLNFLYCPHQRDRRVMFGQNPIHNYDIIIWSIMYESGNVS